MNKKILHQILLICACALLNSFSAAAAPRLWTGLAGDTLWSTSGNWNPAGMPGVSDNVTFTNDGVAVSSASPVNNSVDAGFTSISVNALGYFNTNGFHNTQIINNLNVLSSSATDVANIADDGQPSTLFVGSGILDNKDITVYTTILGNSLTVSNGNANLSVSQISQTGGGHRATLDMTTLNTFNCTVSNVLVGVNFTQPDFAWRPTGELFLAKTNTITTQIICVSDAYENAGGACYIHLGSVNHINSDQVRIGMHKCVGFIDMEAGLTTPSVTFRNAAGTGRQVIWELGDEFDPNGTNYLFGYFTSNQAQGTMDLTGANVDAMVDQIILGRGQIQNDATFRNGDGNGTLIFGGGTIDANTIQMGIQVPGPFIGGSIGRGTLTLNNDAGVGPATLFVHSNIIVAVQQPGSGDTTGGFGVFGSQAAINVNNGSVVNCAGDIVSPGAGGGTATISLNAGGKLDMKPAGDTTAGNVSINILNITDDGIITNYGILSVTNIVLAGSTATFTVYPGESVAPAGVGTAGPLSVTGNLTLRGNTLLDINKTGATLSSDNVSATGTVDLGGTLKVSFSGNTPLAPGDTFTLFAVAPANSSPTVQLPPPGAGYVWVNHIFTDGTISVASCGCPEPTTAPTLSVVNNSTSVTLSWPATYSSFVLRGQTNSSGGIGSNWGGPVPGVVGNQVTIPINPANGSVFFGLFQQ